MWLSDNPILGTIVSMNDIRTTNTGKSVLSFIIASNYGYGDNKGVDYIPCSAWGKTGEVIKKYFNKGDTILLSGDFHNKPYKKYDAGNGKQYDLPNWTMMVKSIYFIPREEKSKEEELKAAGFSPISEVERTERGENNIIGYGRFSDTTDLPF